MRDSRGLRSPISAGVAAPGARQATIMIALTELTHAWNPTPRRAVVSPHTAGTRALLRSARIFKAGSAATLAGQASRVRTDVGHLAHSLASMDVSAIYVGVCPNRSHNWTVEPGPQAQLVVARTRT